MYKEENEMNGAMINKKAVRKNKAMKAAQKAAKKRYGRVRMTSPKARILKVVQLKSEELVSFVSDVSTVLQQNATVDSLSAEELIAKLRVENLAGLSGGGFSTADKLESFFKSNAAKKYLIINGVECEPSLLHDEWVLNHDFEEVKRGIQIVKSVFFFEKSYLASKLPEVSTNGSISYIQVPNRYPMGEEKQLIKTVLGVELSKEEIPAQKGILVMNLQTVLMIGRIICNSDRKNVRFLTAANLEEGTAVVVEAPMGMKAKVIAEKMFPGEPNICIGGGSLNAHPLTADEEIDAMTGFIGKGACLTYDPASKCKGCGGCTANCPAGVDIKSIIRAAEKGQTSGFEAYHPEKCIGCGACSYLCRAGKNTMEVIARINGK